MKAFIISFLIVATLLASCSSSVKEEQLYGRWSYTKIYNADPRDSLPAGELELQSPAIIFSPDHKLVIEWGGKKLSQGKFKMDGNMIRYTENLEGNRTRQFPFLIKSIDNKELVFETMEQSFTRVTARKK